MGLAQFLVCTGFSIINFVFIFLSVTRPKPPLSQILIATLNHPTCDVNLPKADKTLMYGKCYGYCFLCIKYIFFWFYRSVGLEANNEYTKKRYYASHGMCCCCRFHFHYVTNNIVFSASLYQQKRQSLICLLFFDYFLWD